MQALRTARTLALQASRATQASSGDTVLALGDQGRLQALGRSSCSNRDGQVYFQMLLRRFSATSPESVTSSAATPPGKASASSPSGTPSSAKREPGYFYYGHFIPEKLPEGAGKKWKSNLKTKILREVKSGIAAAKLKEAGAPETAAGIPKEELPQDRRAAQHQKEYLARLALAQENDVAAQARREAHKAKQSGELARSKKQKGGKQGKQPSPAATASKASSKASSNAQAAKASSPKAAKARASSGATAAKASSGTTAAKASSGATAAKASSGASAAQASSPNAPTAKASSSNVPTAKPSRRAARANAASGATVAKASSGKTAAKASSDASAPQALPRTPPPMSASDTTAPSDAIAAAAAPSHGPTAQSSSSDGPTAQTSIDAPTAQTPSDVHPAAKPSSSSPIPDAKAAASAPQSAAKPSASSPIPDATAAASAPQPPAKPSSSSPIPDVTAGASAPSSNSDWRVQQKQWQASQRPKGTPASAGIDLLQASKIPPPPPQQQNRKPGFQARGPGRPQGPYPPLAARPAQPEEDIETEMSPEEIKEEEEFMEAEVRGAMYTDKSAKDLGGEDGGLYYPLNAALMPEAFQDFYKGTISEKGGCKGLQDEAAYAKSNLILYRDCIHSLHKKAAEQRHKRVHLTGPRGCGKSIALVSLVDWARSHGWLVLYVPSAQQLIDGGTFQKGEGGLWDTPEVARELLRSMVTNHQEQLAGLTTASGQTLLQLVEEGLNASKPGDTTAAAAALITEMAALEQTPVLVAVDDYNVLYSHTNYHEWMNEVYRRQLQPHELRLASAFRLLERRAPKNGMFVCASTLGGPVSPQLKVPGAALSHDIPKFTIDEAALQLCHYTFQVTHLSTDITVLCCTYVVHLAFIVKDIASNVISTGGSSCAAAQCSAAIAQNILRVCPHMS
ncbi:hypothetical protein ABBQ38_013010 [Trebouxia sp. C0009 RCD-2024]